jgi:hypothetical protein
MKVDFNNVRRFAIHDYNAVVHELMNQLGRELYEDRMERLRDALEELRQEIGIIAACYNDGDPEFADVSQDVKFINFQEPKDEED